MNSKYKYIDRRVDVKAAVALIERSLASEETRFMTRALRGTAALRKKLNSDVLAALVASHLPSGHALSRVLPSTVGLVICENIVKICSN